ncbi:fibroblast growth factor 18-like isoform X2 [Ruditapes philippinarum]|uniref:fibroblast growth factor 18-like isoform X2 n=1 Tax=Ruditapes philippinarum TaxID=129788 RepID=UPI00295BB3A6|nr:fibroblast growth factor 18-like isoform X2 [Ruditapes philippinarum]
MKKSESRRSTICRLLPLLFIVLVGVGSAANQVDGASLRNNPLKDAKVDFFEHFFMNVSDGIEETGTQIRKHLLYNLCSERLVKIIRKSRKGINARGKRKGKNMKFSRLIFESTPSGTIKIYGEHTGLHICFSRKGKLRAQTKGKSKRCQFKEEYSDDKYTHYKTADATKDWYLGFKKNGKPLKGTDINSFNVRNQDCFKFQKLHPTRTSEETICPPGNGDGPKSVNFCGNHILDLIKPETQTPANNRVRHDNKHHKRRGKG